MDGQTDRKKALEFFKAAHALSEKGEYEDALRTFDQAASLDGNFSSQDRIDFARVAHMNAASSLASGKRWLEAIPHMEAACRIKPDLFHYNFLVDICDRAGERGKALANSVRAWEFAEKSGASGLDLQLAELNVVARAKRVPKDHVFN